MPAEQSNALGRSTKGCWTCRIRHRKCDEKNPVCNECTERAVQCHGYGMKPKWLDGGPREMEERSRIKSAVKHNWKRSKTKQSVASRRNGSLVMTEAVTSITTSSFLPQENILQDEAEATLSVSCIPDTLRSASPWQDCQDDLNTHESFENLYPANSEAHVSILQSNPRSTSSTTAELTFQEADLIMHYLDRVFCLQFPYFSSNPARSRGWIFWLLMKNNPLKQAVLSLSALHQHVIFPTSNHHTQDELDVRHMRAIQGLQRFLGEGIGRGLLNKQQVVELLACGTSLISFEVFRGGTGDWQPHLNGLTSALIGTTCLSTAVTQEDRARLPSINATDDSARQEWIDYSYKNLAAVVLWFDILSCISTAQEPRMPYKSWLSNNEIDLSQMMGCQNWAMEEIANLACLDFWKLTARESRTLSMQQLVIRGQEIESRLEKGLKSLDILEQKYNNAEHCTVTRVYALAGLVQLNTILWGPHPGISEVSSAVAKAVLAINDLDKMKLSIRGLVWSICVVGCMAEPCHQAFFENLISTALGQSAGLDFGNVEYTLHIMRKCWEKQTINPLEGYDWRNAMADLNICVLLI